MERSDRALEYPLPTRCGGVLAVLVLLIGGVAATPAVYSQESITIAVVRDGPPVGDDVAAAIESELRSHTPDTTEVTFKADPSFDAGWDPADARRAVESALADPETDLVLATGMLTTVAASELELTRPVVSSFVQRADLFRLPYSEDDRSLQENLSFVVLPQRALREVETFHSLVGFGTLHVAVDPAELAALGDLRAQILALEAQLDARVEIAEVMPDVDAFLAGVGPDVEAIYFTSLPRLTDDSRRRLFHGLAERRIPTFSAVAHEDVERGALMALSPGYSDQLVRRVALNLARLIRGESSADLPVFLNASTRLLINAETMVATGVRLDRATRLFALFLHPEALDAQAQDLSLGEAMRVAEERNNTLSIQDSVVESSEQEAAIARTVLLPQLFADVSHLQTDAALGISSAGLVTDGATRGLLSLRQVVWDDRFRSDYKSAKRLAESSVETRESVRLDVLADAGRSFFGLALAEALYRVQLDNLRLSEDNLELSRLREEVGYSGRDEVLRWEAVVADGRSVLFRANQRIETTRIALNQILNVEQDRRWRTAVVEVDPEVFSFLDGRLAEAFSNYSSLPSTRDAVVEIALENSPEAGALRQVLAAQEIQLNRAKRAWFVPSLFLAGSYATEIDEGDMAITGFEDDVASFSLNLTYPIFQGGLKRSEIAKAEVDLEGLESELRLVEQLVEQQTRTALRQVENSFPRVRLGLEGARAARESLAIVQDKYAEGIVNVTDLLLAQSDTFVAEQQAEAAVYEFLIDLVDLQRAIAWFEEDKSAEERAELADRILAVQTVGGK